MRETTIKVSKKELEALKKARELLAKRGYSVFEQKEVPKEFEEGKYPLGAVATFFVNMHFPVEKKGGACKKKLI